MVSKKNAQDATARISKRMAVTEMENRGGGVNIAGVPLASGTLNVNMLRSRYGLSAG